MNNQLNTLRIQNFKSLRDVTLEPRRVNLLIGKPNSGKSNLLEALSLLGGMFYNEGSKFMEHQIRYENIRNLFYDNDLNRSPAIDTNLGKARLVKSAAGIQYYYADHPIVEALPDAFSLGDMQRFANDIQAGKEGRHFVRFPAESFKACNWCLREMNTSGYSVADGPQHLGHEVAVKKYTFTKNAARDKTYAHFFLQPPLGDNLVDVMQGASNAFQRELASFFRAEGLNLAVRPETQQIEIQKNVGGFITTYPYSLIADTLQRIIFHLSAIESNADSVLLFEEPEAHTFPVYTALLGQRIAHTGNNQFFVATHSQYLTNEVLDTMLRDPRQAREVAVFLAYYEDYETKVKQLSPDEMQQLVGEQDARLDMFLNLGRFTPGPNPYA